MMILRKKTLIAILILAVYLTLHGYLINSMSQSYSGVIVSKDMKENYIINKIKKDGWASQTELEVGDIIKRVDGDKPQFNHFLTQQSFLYAKELVIERNDINLRYKETTTKELDLLKRIYIPAIFSLLTLLLSVFIYQKKSLTANYLIGFLLTASLSYFSANASGRGDWGAKLILVFSIQLGVLLFLYFLYEIFFEKEIINKKRSLILNIITFSGFITIIVNLYSLFFNFIPRLTGLTLIHFSLSIIYSIGFLIYIYKKKKGSIHEPFLKWLIFIKVVAFIPFIFFHAFPYILNLPFIGDDITGLFLFAIPLGYSYLVITRQLLDIDFILSRVRYYAFLSLLPTILISLVVTGTINQNIGSMKRFLLNFILIFVFNVLFLLIKEKVDFSFRNQLFQDKTNRTQSVDHFTKKLSAIMKQDELESVFINEVNTILQPSTIVLIDYNIETSTYTTKTLQDENKNFKFYKQIQWIIQNDLDESLLEYKDFLGIRLYKKDQGKTYIWIGHKKDNTKFNINEKTWLITTVKYIRLVHENLYAVSNMINSLDKQTFGDQSSSLTLSRFLFQLSEKERRRLASDLHDSALQDQIVWYRKLEKLIKENQNLPKETQEELSKIKVGMVDVIKQIRNTCNELRPNLLLELGLIKSLKEMFSQFQQRVKYTLEYDFDNIQDPLDDYNTTLSIYRILQELLNNADKHSEATYVSINIWEENQTLYIDYHDNGKGFDLETLNQKENYHMGLSGLKERILSLDGEVDFISKIGKGLQVHITIPR